jgi:hypothetical protein
MKPTEIAQMVAFHFHQANLQKVGQAVLILMGEYQNAPGKVYNYLPSRPAPWYVRPLGWADDEPGIAYTSEEIAFDSERATVRVPCETCGVLFEPEYGYHEVDKPEESIIGYSYCAECCSW